MVAPKESLGSRLVAYALIAVVGLIVVPLIAYGVFTFYKSWFLFTLHVLSLGGRLF